MDVDSPNSNKTEYDQNTGRNTNRIASIIHETASTNQTIPECVRYGETYIPDSPTANTYTAMDPRPTPQTVTIETKPHWSLEPNDRFYWETPINRKEIKQSFLVSNQEPNTKSTLHGKICKDCNNVHQPELVLAPIYFNRDRAIISPYDISTIANIIKEFASRIKNKIKV